MPVVVQFLQNIVSESDMRILKLKQGREKPQGRNAKYVAVDNNLNAIFDEIDVCFCR